ncbi:DEAD (Asp-Glu-Ala-Asp) box polypeptide 52 [Halocaridina rubra]|uniref:Probable ATP-dependent RNA helicase DDX52 n=1 Tax=Halocaridina rubra TaxID=373956 RepID=A0AAN8ZUQ4_HALRR
MNSYDIFRNLTRGIKFNHKKFGDDLQRIGVSKRDKNQEQNIDREGTHNLSEREPKIESEFSSKDFIENGEENWNVKLFNDRIFDSSLNTSKKSGKNHKDGNSNIKSERQKQLEMMQQKINRIRKLNGIHVWGSDIPEPLLSFDQLVQEYKVNEVLVNNLINQGYSTPMPIQMQAWPLMLQGREVLGSAPTGSGKTAAFLVPILHQLQGPKKKGFRFVVLAPTRELAKQTHRECIRLSEGIGLRCHIISNVNRARKMFGAHTAKKFDILVTTPNRLIYLLQEGDTPGIDLSKVEWLVIDESDRLFEAGIRGFRDQLAVIYKACSNPLVKRALFSATFAFEVQHWCKLNLDNVAMVSIGARNSASEDVKQELLFCGAEHGKLFALRDILRKGYKPPVLIFVQTKERAKELFKELVYDNIMVDAIHADRTQLQRDKVVHAFRERKIWVLICTELMARGIDFKGVNLVINYDFPQSVISYIHRVGRTGRAHHVGRAVTFWTLDDKPKLRSIAQIIHNSGHVVPEWMLTLEKPGKRRKKTLQRTTPVRGHVSQYDVYREREFFQKKIKETKSRKLAKKALRETEVQENDASPLNIEQPLAASDEISTKKLKRKHQKVDMTQHNETKRKKEPI